jgi:uncharacterized membrane protein
LSNPFAAYLRHHFRFTLAALLGLGAYFAAVRLGDPLPLAAAGDAFFFIYLCLHVALAIRLTHEDLDRRASDEDEGILIVALLTVAAISLSCIDIFTALNQKHPPAPLELALALVGAPFGWATLHTISAFHYANLYYFDHDPTEPDSIPPLRFPQTEKPGPWDFLYFSFVVGMTAQVSDVLVQTARMRRSVLFHSVAAFFFNTVLIAMAVNAAVSAFQASH